MRKREGGQAFILVLIFLAIGALLAVPALRLTGTALKSSQIVTQQAKALYMADAAQEYVLWKFLYDGLGANFTDAGDNLTLSFEVCGTSLDVFIVMRADIGIGALTLATDDVIRPTKTVSPDTVDNDVFVTFTYTIRLEQLSDNTSQGLDAVYDILPKGFEEFDYVPNSSRFRVGGGPWETIGDPFIDEEASQVILRWPASGNFSSPIRDFTVRQVKELEFQFGGMLPKNKVHCNWVVLKPWDTLSRPEAPITVGTPPDPSVYGGHGYLAVYKFSDPEVIQPGVETDIEYTVNITNLDTDTHHIAEIKDYLPPGFTYTDNTTGGITTINPQLSLENINGADRWVLRWTKDEFPGGGEVDIASGETLSLTFWVLTTKDISGTYYNETIVDADVAAPTPFAKIGVSNEEYSDAYSWPAAGVIVPAYDSEAEADGVTVDANMALIAGGISIRSWQVR